MIGERLLNLRKKKGLSQEEVAEKLNVTRQTISKWETEQSSPDFDKIIPLCKLYQISTDELLTGKKEDSNMVSNNDHKNKKALGISIGVLIYFIALCFIMITIPVLDMDPIIASSIFLLLCGVATAIIVYVSITTKSIKTVRVEQNPLLRRIYKVISLIMVIIYLLVSFITQAWHITWILFIVLSLVYEIVKLIFMLKENMYEK